MSAKARDQRSRSILDAVHGEPAVQEGAAPVRPRRAHALHHGRWTPGARRHVRAVVRQCRPLPAEDRRGDPQAGRRARFRRHLPDGPSKAFECASKLVNIAPPGFDHVFFTNSGSESVETALKIALAYHRVKGNAAKTRLIGRERGYHGVNFGGTSVGGIANNRKMFGTLLSGVDHLRHTHDLVPQRLQPRRAGAWRRARRRSRAARRAARRLDHRRGHRRAGGGLGRRADPAQGLSASASPRSATSTTSCSSSTRSSPASAASARRSAPTISASRRTSSPPPRASPTAPFRWARCS